MLTNLSLTQKVVFVLILTLVVQLPFVISLALMQRNVTHQIDEGLRIQATIAHLNKVSILWSSLTADAFRMFVHGRNAGSLSLPDYSRLFREEFRETGLLLQNNDDRQEILTLETNTNSTLDLLNSLKQSWSRQRAGGGSLPPEEGLLHNEHMHEIGPLADLCAEASNKLIDRFLIRQNNNHLAQSRSQTLWKFALLSGLSLNFVLVVAIAYLFIKEVAHKFALITENSLRLADGQVLHPPLDGADEISLLDQNFHKMADTIVAANIKERAVVDNALDLICSLSADGNFLSVNPAAQLILGYRDSELLGKSYTDFVVEADGERIGSMLKRLVGGETVAPFEHGAIRKTGSNVELEMSAHWSKIDQSLFCVVYDVTQRREVERMKREFTNVITHDLRVPLLNTRNTLELLSSGCDDEKVAMTRVDQASLEIRPIQRLISNLLELEKIDAEMLTLSLKRINLSAIIEEAVESVRKQASDQDIVVSTHLTDALIEVDQTRLLQAMTTLLINSIKRSPSGGEVAITCQKDEHVRIEISDSGPQLSSDDQERLFEPFKQTKPTADENLLEGASLGIAVCKSIIEAHQGTIGVVSKGLSGTTFWIQLPLCQQA